MAGKSYLRSIKGLCEIHVLESDPSAVMLLGLNPKDSAVMLRDTAHLSSVQMGDEAPAFDVCLFAAKDFYNQMSSDFKQNLTASVLRLAGLLKSAFAHKEQKTEVNSLRIVLKEQGVVIQASYHVEQKVGAKTKVQRQLLSEIKMSHDEFLQELRKEKPSFVL